MGESWNGFDSKILYARIKNKTKKLYQEFGIYCVSPKTSFEGYRWSEGLMPFFRITIHLSHGNHRDGKEEGISY